MSDPRPGGWFADTAERLVLEFEQHHPLAHILAITQRCRVEIEGSGTPATALPELVERLARQRLGSLGNGRGPDRASP